MVLPPADDSDDVGEAVGKVTGDGAGEGAGEGAGSGADGGAACIGSMVYGHLIRGCSVGTVMKVMYFERLEGESLFVVAQGVARFRVAEVS